MTKRSPPGEVLQRLAMSAASDQIEKAFALCRGDPFTQDESAAVDPEHEGKKGFGVGPR